jgi:hypothetical protein
MTETTNKQKSKASTTTRSGAVSSGNKRTVEKEVKDLKEEQDKLLGKITKLTEQKLQQDENITLLFDRVSKLEQDAETRALESLEDAVKKKLDAWVVADLVGILDKKSKRSWPVLTSAARLIP